MRILVTRPEPEALRLRAMLEARGHAVVVEPLMRVEYMAEALDSLDGVGALVATSRNSIRALLGSPFLEVARGLPLFTVGAGTAEEAQQAGFERIFVGPGTAGGLAAFIASTIEAHDGVIAHLAGDVLAGDLAGALAQHGFRVFTAVVYRMDEARSLSEAALDALADREIDAVILMSARTAAVYVRLLVRHRLTDLARGLQHLCLSQAVARPLAVLGPVPHAIAGAPTLTAVMALVDRLARQLDY